MDLPIARIRACLGIGVVIGAAVAASGCAERADQTAAATTMPEAAAPTPAATPAATETETAAPAISVPETAAPTRGPALAPGWGHPVTSNGGSYYVEYRIDGGEEGAGNTEIPLNAVFAIDVHLFDGADHTVVLDDATLELDGRMPEHRHGMNREPTVTRNPDGSYTVSGMLFHMPGLWELHFDITRDGVTERAQVDVELE